MNQDTNLSPPGMQGFLARLANVEGTVTINHGVVTFPDGTTADLNLLRSQGLSNCYHCGGLMTSAQRYVCGCPKCIDASRVLEAKACC